MQREYYSDSISNFISTPPSDIVGKLTLNSEFAVDIPQRDAWLQQINVLQDVLPPYEGTILFEFSVPRMGKRIDVILIISSVILVLEFKIGSTQFTSQALTQAWDYALDLKNFHETSREPLIAPILIATEAANKTPPITVTPHNDNLLYPIACIPEHLQEIVTRVLSYSDGVQINDAEWMAGRYRPTPTIVEAAIALYNNHSVLDIARNDASAINLGITSGAIEEIIRKSKANSHKSICFVTGVPGAGKTLVGLNVATQHNDPKNDLHSVFLSGNGPLVKVLTEALARDRVQRERTKGVKPNKGRARSEVKAFIQNVHHFRDECLIDPSPPPEHVALFDEAQRAWNLQETANFMKQKKKRPNFDQSEPQFLISCLNRHADWAVIVCLVGGGQEINRGEAGITEWIRSLKENFPDWRIYISSRLTDSEYGAGQILNELQQSPTAIFKDELHLSVSMRSFRAENVSLLVKQILDLDHESARHTLAQVAQSYPIVITRDLSRAKEWLREKARGSERFGIQEGFFPWLRSKPYGEKWHVTLLVWIGSSRIRR